MDAETLEALRDLVGEETGIPPGHRHRLRGAALGELRQDAAGMRTELGLDPPADPRPPRDRGGRYSKSGGIYDINREIRRVLP